MRDPNKVYDENHDPETGLFKKGNKASVLRNNPELAREIAASRLLRSRQTAVQALEDAAMFSAPNLRKDVEEYGWYAVLYHITNLILTAKDPKGLAELIKLLGTATGNIGREQSESDGEVRVSKAVTEFIGNLADVVRAKENM